MPTFFQLQHGCSAADVSLACAGVAPPTHRRPRPVYESSANPMAMGRRTIRIPSAAGWGKPGGAGM